MADDRDYEAGAELDPDAKAFLEREGGDDEPPAGERKARPEADFDASARKVGDADEDAGGQDDDNAGPDEAEQARVAELERQARSEGWVPKDEFRGHNGKAWVDAQEFLDRASPAKLRERLDRVTADREKDREDYNARVERVEKIAIESAKRQQADFDKQMAAWKKERDRQIAQVGKDEGEEAALNHGAEWDKFLEKQQRPEIPEEPARPAATVDARPPETVAWIGKHPQFETDQEFGLAAFGAMQKIEKELAGKPLSEQFAELDKRLSRRFPEYYGTSNGNAQGERRANGGAPPADARAGAMDGVRINPKKTTSYANRLNATERRLGQRFVERGDFKSLEDYAKELHAND